MSLPHYVSQEAFDPEATVAAGGLILLGFALALHGFSRTYRALDSEPDAMMTRPRPALADD